MRYLIFIILFLPLITFAVTGENTRFDWSGGRPIITDDATSTCNDTTIARFDWSSGKSIIVYDATANCTLAVGAIIEAPRPQIIWFDGVVLEESLIKYKA